ncbi:hypothetical protein MUK42_33976, partial [Musa troglodytarum]
DLGETRSDYRTLYPRPSYLLVAKEKRSSTLSCQGYVVDSSSPKSEGVICSFGSVAAIIGVESAWFGRILRVL